MGEPVTATVTASNFNPKHTLTYVWNPSNGGGKVIGKDATAQIETTNAAPGSYTVTAHVTDTKEKKNNEASCSANFIVKPPPPKNHAYYVYLGQPDERSGRWNRGFVGQLHQP